MALIFITEDVLRHLNSSCILHMLLYANPAFPRYFWKVNFSVWELKTQWFLDHSVEESAHGPSSLKWHQILQHQIYTPIPNKKPLTIHRRSKVTTRGYLRSTGEFKSNSAVFSACSYKDFEDTPVKLHISYFIKTSELHYFYNAVESFIFSVALLNEKSWFQLQQDASSCLFITFFYNERN